MQASKVYKSEWQLITKLKFDMPYYSLFGVYHNESASYYRDNYLGMFIAPQSHKSQEIVRNNLDFYQLMNRYWKSNLFIQ